MISILLFMYISVVLLLADCIVLTLAEHLGFCTGKALTDERLASLRVDIEERLDAPN